MAVEGSQSVRLNIVSTVAGQICHNILYYSNFSLVTRQGVVGIMDAWDAAFMTGWLGLLSVNATVLRIEGTTFDDLTGTTGITQIKAINQPGLETGDMLPPYVSLRLYKFPDPELSEPIDVDPPFRKGMIRLSGIPESGQVSGLLTPSYQAEATAFAPTLRTFAVAATTWGMVMNRADPTVTGGQAYATISAIVAGSVLGTQNSRKIGS